MRVTKGRFKNKITRYSIFALLSLVALTFVMMSFNPFIPRVTTQVLSPVPQPAQHPISTGSGGSSPSLLTSPSIVSHNGGGSDDGAQFSGSGSSVTNIDD